MDSRPLLKKLKNVGILIDSKTFEESLNEGNRTAFALLSYSRNDYVTYIRSPIPSRNESLNEVPQYNVTIPEKEVSPINPPGKLVYENDKCRTTKSFTYQSKNIINHAKTILRKAAIDSDEFDSFLLVCVLATLNGISSYNKKRDEIFILITQNETLLKNRLRIESNFYTIQLNIMSIEEASIFLDLFFKKNGLYLVSGNFQINNGGWYLHSLRSKIPHCNMGEPIIAALAKRMQYALMALDEIGIQYYQGVDLDTQDNTLYHFNYLISLITGIFDNLAIKTNDSFKINFPYPAQISLSSSNKSGFLKQVKEKDPVLRKLILENGHLITLIYSFRELVIHREGLDRLSFHYNSDEGQWRANFIKISKNELNLINLCGDKKSEYDNISNWGVHTDGDNVFLEPYHFSFEMLKMLIPFVDKYLELIHHSSFIEKQQQIDSDFYRMMKVFDENHLGF